MDVLVAEHKDELESLRERIRQSSAGANKAIVKAGWVLKRKEKGRGKVSSWKRRFLVVDTDSISYFREPGEERLGVLELVVVSCSLGEERGKTHVIMSTPQSSYGVVPEEGSAAEWMEAVQDARRKLFGGKGEGSRRGQKAMSKLGIGPMQGSSLGSNASNGHSQMMAMGGAAALAQGGGGAGGGGGGSGGIAGEVGATTLGANYMAVASGALEEGDSQQRMAALAELVATEEVYVRNLQVCVRHYMQPLQEMCGHEAASIFGNMQLLESVNGQLLARLKKPESKRDVGQQFLSMLPFFKMYKDYCGNQENATQVLEKLKKQKKQVREFLEKQRDSPAVSSMNVEAYLIMPMQRICRYPLVLQEIYKHTPDDWSDKTKLKEALEAVSQVGREVNEQKRQAEQQLKVLEIQTELLKHNKDIGGNILSPSRRLIGDKEIAFARIIEGASYEEEGAHVYLFNDLLLVCSRDKKKLKLVKRMEFSSNCTLQELPRGLEEPVGFAVQEASVRIELHMEENDGPTEKEWRAALQEAFLQAQRNHHTRTSTMSAPVLIEVERKTMGRRTSVGNLQRRDSTTGRQLSRSATATGSSLWRRGTVVGQQSGARMGTLRMSAPSLAALREKEDEKRKQGEEEENNKNDDGDDDGDDNNSADKKSNHSNVKAKEESSDEEEDQAESSTDSSSSDEVVVTDEAHPPKKPLPKEPTEDDE